MIEVGIGDGRLGHRKRASMIACVVAFRFAWRSVGADTKSNGGGSENACAKRYEHRYAGHACAPDPMYHIALGPISRGQRCRGGLPRKHRRAQNVTHTNDRVTCVCAKQYDC